jgi:hypothetical protein
MGGLINSKELEELSDWGTASFAGTTLGLDRIQEYKVLTSTYDQQWFGSAGRLHLWSLSGYADGVTRRRRLRRCSGNGYRRKFKYQGVRLRTILI